MLQFMTHLRQQLSRSSWPTGQETCPAPLRRLLNGSLQGSNHLLSHGSVCGIRYCTASGQMHLDRLPNRTPALSFCEGAKMWPTLSQQPHYSDAQMSPWINAKHLLLHLLSDRACCPTAIKDGVCGRAHRCHLFLSHASNLNTSSSEGDTRMSSFTNHTRSTICQTQRLIARPDRRWSAALSPLLGDVPLDGRLVGPPCCYRF